MPRTEARCCQRAARTFHSQLSLIKTARTQGTNCMWRLGKGTHGTSYSEASLISDTKTAPSRHWYDGPISQLGARHGLAVHSALCCNYVPSLAVPAYLLSVVDPVVLVGRRNWVASGRGRGVARTWSVTSRRIVAAPCLLPSTGQAGSDPAVSTHRWLPGPKALAHRWTQPGNSLSRCRHAESGVATLKRT